MEEIIQHMLSYVINMKTFVDLVTSDGNLIAYINSYVPEDSKKNPNHPIWLQFSYDSMEKVEFNLWDEIRSTARFDDSIEDNLNIFGIVRTFYCYSHPDFQPTKRYNEEFDFLLDVVGERYGGPEVETLINNIISQYISITPKTRRIREAKDRIATIFHISEKKYPRWINGAEWPMGESSPMKFVSQRRYGEKVEYLFADIDTGTQRIVEQFY